MSKLKTFLLFTVVAYLSLGFPFLLAAQDPSNLEKLNGFDAFVAAVMKEWKVPGLAISIVRDGQVIFARGFGYRDLAGQLPVTPHTVFGIGSCSKAFTATTLGILVDEGKLEWDKPVREYLPAFKLSDEVASERLTPLDLLTHRSGLPRHDNVWIRSPLSRREMFDRLRYLEFSRDIRQTYQYNNLMVMTAGYLAGIVAGSSWEEFAKARILDPLGMVETNFSTDVSRGLSDFAKSYTLVKDQVEEFPFYNADALGPAGSINSNVLDMAAWVLLNINKGKYGEKFDRQIISERRLNQVHAPQVVVANELRYPELYYPTYGMGWRRNAYRGRPLVSHGGAIMGFSATVAFMPMEKIGIVLLNNLEDAPVNSTLMYNVIDRLLGLEPVDWAQRVRDEQAKAKAEREKRAKDKDADRQLGTQPSHPLAAYAGSYEHPAYGTIEVRWDGEKLTADYHQRTFVFEHYHYDMFKMRNDWMDTEYKVTFATDPKGGLGSFSVPFETSVKDIIFVRKIQK